MVAVASTVENLQGNPSTGRVDGLGHFPVLVNLTGLHEGRAMGRQSTGPVRGNAPCDDETRTTLGTLRIEASELGEPTGLLLEVHVHRAHDGPVGHPHAGHLQRLHQVRILRVGWGAAGHVPKVGNCVHSPGSAQLNPKKDSNSRMSETPTMPSPLTSCGRARVGRHALPCGYRPDRTRAAQRLVGAGPVILSGCGVVVVRYGVGAPAAGVGQCGPIDFDLHVKQALEPLDIRSHRIPDQHGAGQIHRRNPIPLDPGPLGRCLKHQLDGVPHRLSEGDLDLIRRLDAAVGRVRHEVRPHIP